MRGKNPFNDITAHYSTDVGLLTNKVEMKKMLKPLRFIGYFLDGGLGIVAVTYIVMTYI